KLDEAEAFCSDALAMQRKLLGEDHPDTARTLNRLAVIFQREGKLADADTLLRNRLPCLRARLPADDPQLAAALSQLASILLAEQKFVEAEEMAGECLAVREKRLPEDWVTFNSRSMMGGALLGQQKYAEAEPLLLSGYEGMKQREAKVRYAGAEPRLREALQRLVQLFEATARPEEAVGWKNKLEELNSLERNKATGEPKETKK